MRHVFSKGMVDLRIALKSLYMSADSLTNKHPFFTSGYILILKCLKINLDIECFSLTGFREMIEFFARKMSHVASIIIFFFSVYVL